MTFRESIVLVINRLSVYSMPITWDGDHGYSGKNRKDEPGKQIEVRNGLVAE